MLQNILLYLIVLLLFFSCSKKVETRSVFKPDSNLVFVADTQIVFDRTEILENLQTKIDNNEPLIIHAFVALFGYNEEPYGYDALLDGTNLNSNVYWGAGYGVKTYFSKYDNWTKVYQEDSLTEDILQRIVFYKTFQNGAKVYLIADAYLGWRMYQCLHDYFFSLNEIKLDSILLSDKKIAAYGNADLLVFNGHNGLMDTYMEPPTKKCNRPKDAVAICCMSKPSFSLYFKNYYAYPLLTTTTTIPAEAYILGQIIEPWVMLKDEEEIRENVVDKFLKIHKNEDFFNVNLMFSAGWDNNFH